MFSIIVALLFAIRIYSNSVHCVKKVVDPFSESCEIISVGRRLMLIAKNSKKKRTNFIFWY